MPNNLDTVYAVILVRTVNEGECEEDRFVGQGVYAHRRSLLSFLKKGKREISSILEEISANQPSGLSDEQVKEYFERQMGRKGFRRVNLDKEGFSIKRPYSYRFKD